VTARDRVTTVDVRQGARLERAYGRLLMAYPRGYREQRGPEILGVLVDGARPGQRFPRLREVVDILIGGARQRLGVNTSPGLAEGLRIALPVALMLAAGLSFGVRAMGNQPVMEIQPYAYAWSAALLAWVIAPAAGRVTALAAAAFTLRTAAAWSFVESQVVAICLLSVVAAIVAVLAPRLPDSTAGRGLATALWQWPVRVATLGPAGLLALVGLYSARLDDFTLIDDTVWRSWTTVVIQLTVLVLGIAGAAVALRARGTGLLWSAALLAPAAAVAPMPDWQLYGWAWNGYGPDTEHPWLLLRLSLHDVQFLLIPLLAATALRPSCWPRSSAGSPRSGPRARSPDPRWPVWRSPTVAWSLPAVRRR
jgi:hypothetical protein